MPFLNHASDRVTVVLLALATCAALPGCAAVQGETAADVAGIGGAAISDALGASGAAAAGIGLGVRAATRAGLQYAQRNVRGAAQDRLAAVAGPLAPGAIAPWSTDHSLPLELPERGRVTVSRVVSPPPFACKEIVFSVDAPEGDASARAPDGDASARAPDGDASARALDGDASARAPDGDDAASRFYTATICQDGARWRWATAEPAVARWGNLQ
jgi:hypothetical protein